MRVSGKVQFNSPIEKVYAHLARGVFAHAVEGSPGESRLLLPMTLLTRYETKAWRWTITTTEEATLDPGGSITWRHVDGPLSGSVETFTLGEIPGGGTMAIYSGDLRARNKWFRGPGDRFFVAPMTRRVSMASLEAARRAVDGG